MGQRAEILEAYRNGEDIDRDIRLRSDVQLRFRGGWKAKVDTIFLQYEPRYEEYPHFNGYAHAPGNDDYVSDWLEADDITNVDLSDYMAGYDIIDLEGLIADHPEIFYS